MDGTLFDTFTKRIAINLSRRRLMGGLAGLTLAGGIHRPAAASRAAFPKWPTDCFPYPSCCITPILNGPGCVCEGCDPDEDDGGGDGGDDGEFTLASYQTQTSSTFIAGISGAGSVLTANGLAHFSLFASLMAGTPDLPEGATVPFARVQWRDPQVGFTLESTRTVLYGPIDGTDGGRGIAGMAKVNGAEEYFFLMSAVATESVGEGQESVSLLVGDAVTENPDVGFDVEPAGFAYAAEGELIAGDLQLLDIDLAQQIVVQPSP